MNLLSQHEVARQLGLPQEMINDWVRPQTGVIQLVNHPSVTPEEAAQLREVARRRKAGESLQRIRVDLARTGARGTEGTARMREDHPHIARINRIMREDKLTLVKAAIRAEEEAPEEAQSYRQFSTRGTPAYQARIEMARGEQPAPRAKAGQTATMAKILFERAQRIGAARAEGRKLSIEQADRETFSEHPELYTSYLRENTRGSAIRQLGPVGAPEPKVNKDGAAATWRSILLLDADGNAVTDMQKRIAMLAPFFAGLIGFEVASAAPPITGLPRNPGNTFWAEFHDAAAVKGLLPFPDPGEVTK